MAKQKNTYSITGRIIDAKTRSVAGLRVEAWDKDLIIDILVENIGRRNHKRRNL